MRYKSVFKYYGGKFNQLKDILSILENNLQKFDVIVDVFGGSGKVLLNIPNEWRKLKVYNDLNRDLYRTFKVLQNDKKRVQLERRLRLSYLHYDAFQELKLSNPRSDIDMAFKTIYLHTHSYLADGKSFGRRFTGKQISRFTIENWLLVRDWIVENKDFRDLLDIYNKPRVLIYLDPPYLSSGKKYKHSFKRSDLEDLKTKIDSHCGSFLLNLSLYDNGMEDIFGKPQKIVDYANPANSHGKKKWECGYWYSSAFVDPLSPS